MIVDNPARYTVQTLPVSDRGTEMRARAGAFHPVSRSLMQTRMLTAYLFFSCSYRSLARRVPSAKSFLAFSGKVRLRAA